MPIVNRHDRPVGEGDSPTPRMHVSEESDRGVVPMNRSNNDGQPWAESGEGRPLIEENTPQPHTSSTQREIRVSQGLAGVRKAAKDRKGMKFTALLHHITVGRLKEGFFALKRRAAPGWTASRGGSMKSAWTIDSSISTAECTAAPIRRGRRGECRSRSPMGGNVRWGSRRWRTRSSNTPWSPSSLRSMRRIFGASRTGSDQDATSIRRWTR
jgi:hypothetical protein